MKEKKGFTLVELLAVIAILAILVIMALPAVLRMFNSARRDSFTNEVNTVIRTARQQYLLSGGTDTTWSNAEGSTSTLDLTGNSQLRYYVKMNNEGKITKLQVTNGDYQYNVTNNSGIDIAESSDVQAISELGEGDVITITATGFGGNSNIYNGGYSSSEETALQLNTEHYSLPILSKSTLKEIQGWCLYNNSSGWRSCDEYWYWDTEEACLTWGSNFTCKYESFNIVDTNYFGFSYNGTTNYLNLNDSFETNRDAILNVFGTSNCSGDIAMSNTSKTLMNILGIVDVKAIELIESLCVTCNASNYSISVFSDSKISASNSDWSCTLERDNPNLSCIALNLH